MKQKLINILSNMRRYNASNLAEMTFGLDTMVEYDALVVAPGWKPTNPAIALLIVSDNSATRQPLLGRNEEQQRKYNDGRRITIPDLIYKIAKK